MHEENMGGTGPVCDDTTNQEAAPRKRQAQVYENERITGILGYDNKIKFDKFFESFPIDEAKEDEFISTFSEAVKALSQEEFVTKTTGNLSESRKLVAEKVKELNGLFPGQEDAIELASILSFNENGYPTSNPEQYIEKITNYLKSDEAKAEKEFNSTVALEILPYPGPGGEPGGYRLALNGEQVISYKQSEGGSPEKLQILSGLINDLTTNKIRGFKQITPRDIIDKFKTFQGYDDAGKKSKAELLELLTKGDRPELVLFITGMMEKEESPK